MPHGNYETGPAVVVEDDADAVLASALQRQSPEGLLRVLYSLTHQMTNADAVRENELRIQRNKVEDEVLRRLS